MTMSEHKGLPGLRGVEHIGVTVPDFDQAYDFFVNVLGFKPFYAHGPYKGDWMESTLNVHPDAEIRKVQQLCGGAGLNIELFEYASPDQKQKMPRNTDWGGHHIAIYVDDIDAAVAHLKANGVRVMKGGDPGPEIASGPEAGARSCYFLTPWDFQMELISYPRGKAYEKDYDTRLWDPRHPER
jgi:catechol 2,3-dioxygenase-like lactoylglutathione lyase family enzyme